MQQARPSPSLQMMRGLSMRQEKPSIACVVRAVCATTIHFIMERNRQVRSLGHLLDSVEMAYKTDVKLYTSGCLNHNKLCKPSEKIKQRQWYSARKRKREEGTDRLRMRLKRDELDVSEIMVLKNKPVKNSHCVVELAKEEYQFIPSYLAGVTKTEQFNKFLHFQKEFIAKHELLQNDFTGSKVSEQHESKKASWLSVTLELQKICGCHPLHFKLQVVEEVFEDICNSSLIFGDILKEIKSEYELYMMMLLDSLPIAQYETEE
ncbi:LOW QUALITY PROTEIN: uncharacterized protein C6orf118 homolog [Theristicus caerulescens]